MNASITADRAATNQVKMSTYQPWIVCFSAALFFFFEFMQVNIFNAITPALMKEFSLSAIQVGQMSANYFYANLLFLFPAGMILDRFSTKKVILFAMASSVACAYIFALVNHVWAAELCRFITGIGGSFCLISCIRLASNWFPPRRLALVIGLIVTLAMFGGMLAQTPMTLLTDLFGWRKMFMINASIGAVMLIVIFIFVKDHPPGHSAFSHQALNWQEFTKSLKKSLLNRQNWLGGLYTSLLNLPVFLMGAMWGGLYLVQIHDLSRTQSSFVTSMIFVGTIIGSPVIGWFSDRISLRRLPMLLCAFVALLLILILMFVPHLSLVSLLLLFLGIGIFTSAQILSYPLIAESNPRALTGTAEGIASILIMAGGISQPLFGALITLNWDQKLSNGVPVYSYHDFLLGLSIIPVAFVISIICALLIRETNCQRMD
jgi:MFS family permease